MTSGGEPLTPEEIREEIDALALGGLPWDRQLLNALAECRALRAELDAAHAGWLEDSTDSRDQLAVIVAERNVALAKLAAVEALMNDGHTPPDPSDEHALHWQADDSDDT